MSSLNWWFTDVKGFELTDTTCCLLDKTTSSLSARTITVVQLWGPMNIESVNDATWTFGMLIAWVESTDRVIPAAPSVSNTYRSKVKSSLLGPLTCMNMIADIGVGGHLTRWTSCRRVLMEPGMIRLAVQMQMQRVLGIHRVGSRDAFVPCEER